MDFAIAFGKLVSSLPLREFIRVTARRHGDTAELRVTGVRFPTGQSMAPQAILQHCGRYSIN